MNIVITGIIIFVITFLLLSWFAKQKTQKIAKAVSPFILRADKAKKNNGKENNILPPIAKIIAINRDKITIKVLTPFAIFWVFCRANQDNNKNVMTKIIIPVITIFI